MAKKKGDKTIFCFCSKYDEGFFKWDSKEKAALGNLRDTAKVIKKRLESNNLNIEEMYAIEHTIDEETGEKSADPHFHIFIKLDVKSCKSVEELAKYIGISPAVFADVERGKYTADNLRAYLIHAKQKKIKYKPQDVFTLAGKDYMDYYNSCHERWESESTRTAPKTMSKLYNEVVKKIESGEICFNELNKGEYRKLLFTDYAVKLRKKQKLVDDVIDMDLSDLREDILNGVIKNVDDIMSDERYAVVYKYRKEDVEKGFKDKHNKDLEQEAEKLCVRIRNGNLTYFDVCDDCQYEEMINDFDLDMKLRGAFRDWINEEIERIQNSVLSSDKKNLECKFLNDMLKEL